MKIRTVTYGLSLTPAHFLDDGVSLNQQLARAVSFLDSAKSEFEGQGHVLQTVRISLNSFEDWLLPLLDQSSDANEASGFTAVHVIRMLDASLRLHGIQFCTIGCCSSFAAIQLLPSLLKQSNLLSGSVAFTREVTLKDGSSTTAVAPDLEKCKAAAAVCLQLAEDCGDLGNFRFAVLFNCSAGIPFFPAAYHSSSNNDNSSSRSDSASISTISSNCGDSISLGLECGDLLFIAFHGTDSCEEGAANLRSVLQQVLLPLQQTLQQLCSKHSVQYGGIDASINPGLELPYSVGAGLEDLLPEPNNYFGAMGTLAAVSAITTAVKSLGQQSTASSASIAKSSIATTSTTTTSAEDEQSEVIRLTGYSGLMLPVMEDLVLAQRASEGRYSLRDLLTFSSVCGVGLDTVPVPGNTTVAQLAGVYSEVGALAFRLNKPLSCRVLPMTGKSAGDLTTVDSPYLCNTTVFSIP